MPTVSVPLRASPAFVLSAAWERIGIDSPRPAPQNAQRGDDVRGRRRGDERERDESQREQRRAAADGVQGWKPALEGADRERRCREHADDGRAADRRVPPDRDHEEDCEEEHAHEGAEEQTETDVRRDGAAEHATPAFLELDGRSDHGGDQRKSCHRRLGDEDRAPVERLGERPAERGSERGAECPGERPDRRSGARRSGERDEHGKRAGEQQRRADSLDAPRRDQERQATGRRAGDGRGKKEDEPCGKNELAVDPVHEQHERERRDRDRDVVRSQHPRHALDRGVELAVELRQRENDDRRVGEGETDNRGDKTHGDTIPPSDLQAHDTNGLTSWRTVPARERQR